MNFPTAVTISIGLTKMAVANSMLVLGGCESAEKQIGDVHVPKVPSVYVCLPE